jgi:putative ABC transport system permease protein
LAKKVDPDYPFAYDFVDKEYKDRIAVMCKKPVHNTQFCGDPNCTFGLFCLASFSIERRHEIAIRKHSAQSRCFTKRII